MTEQHQGTCEVVKGGHPNPLQRVCDRPAMVRYPAKGGGYMRLCEEHGAKHRGGGYGVEVWTGAAWAPDDVATVRKDA